MKIEMIIVNKKGHFKAKGIYDGQKVIVQKGGFINPNFASCIRGGNLSKQYRADRNYVSENNEIITDCVFRSPSTAAQFITGRSVNGYKIWKVSNDQSLDDYLKDKGLR